MLLQSLSEYYEILTDDPDSGIAKLNYSKTDVSFALNISQEGKLLEILPLKKTVQRGNKDVEIPQSFLLPERIKKTSGVNSNFLCDNSAYVLGIDNKAKPERAKQCFDAFKELHNKILSNIECSEAKALLNFLNTWSAEDTQTNDVLKKYFDAIAAGPNLIFRLDGVGFIHENPKIKQAWENYVSQKENADCMQCLVSGKMLPVAKLHPSIKGIKGAQSSGASLVSFNASSYESYGKDKLQGLNAPVSEKSAFSYSTALNYLVNDRNRVMMLGDATVVYWAQCAGNHYRNAAMLLFSPDQIQMQESEKRIQDKFAEESVSGMLKQIAQGKNFNELELIKDDTDFYILGLSPNAARLSVRFFTHQTFGDFTRNILKHYSDLQMEKQFETEPDCIPVWRILAQTVSPKSKDKSASPLLSGAVIRSILNGTQYPNILLNSIMMRIKAEHDINYYKASIIKAYLTRLNNRKYKEEMSVSLNENNDNIAYLLGRLFAVLEKAQKDANPGINTTIKDRYFTSACSTPASVFPILLRLSQHHISKAEYGNNSDRRISEIIEKIDLSKQGIPSNLSLEDQGVFVIGYYHQRNRLYQKQENKKGE